MNWIRENKFLTGFIAVVAIGAGVLGYLLYTAWGTYSDVTDQYNAKATELQRLQHLSPYPNNENLAKYRAERDDLIDATHNLGENLARMVLPVQELSPSAFQDNLRDSVTAVIAKAGQAGVKLPDKFAMDFDRYQTQPPVANAASVLGRQLAAIQLAMNILIDDRVDAVTSLKRGPLPQEGGGGGGNGGGHQFGSHGGGASRSGGGLVEKFPFDIQFTSGQSAFQKVLNDFAASDKQFFITRTLVVENSGPKPVAKDLPTPAPDASPAASPAPGSAPSGPTVTGAPGTPDNSGGGTTYLRFIVGTEKLNVAMRVEMVTFNSPEKSARKPAAPAPARNP